jgi:hypothetical protein
MKQLIYILIIFSFSCCCNDKPAHNLQNSTAINNNIIFPTKANFKNPDHPEEDTLIAIINKTDFLITPAGKIYWGQNPNDTIHLLTNVIIEKAYLHLIGDTLFVFYTETDHGGATSGLEKLDIRTKRRIWKTEIPGFNLGLPYIINNLAYVTTIGGIGKLNLVNGKYIYQYLDLYDDIKYSFNSFDTIVFKGDLTIFLSKNFKSKRTDSLIVNEKTGGHIVGK